MKSELLSNYYGQAEMRTAEGAGQRGGGKANEYLNVIRLHVTGFQQIVGYEFKGD
jgi:hypothetical protein